MSEFKRIIPCLDVNQGRVVKGVNFVDIKDAGDPVEIAKRYSEQGADELTTLDISATVEGRDTMVDVVERIVKVINVPLAVGGGIRSVADVERMLAAGASKVGINSAAISNPELIKEAAKAAGSQRIIIAIDGKQTGANTWEVVTHGGKKFTGIDAVEWAKKMADFGAGEILLTSLDRDGTKDGFDLTLTRAISEAVNIPVIASGGVGNLQHLVDGIIEGKADAVLAASIFHFGEFTVPQAKQYMQERGIKVRL